MRGGKRRCRSGPCDEEAEGVHKYPSWDGSEGGEEAVHIPTGVTYVTEKQFFLVKGTSTHWHCMSSEGGLAV